MPAFLRLNCLMRHWLLCLLVLALPAQAGTTAVQGKIVCNTLTVVAGAPFEILSAVIG